MLLSIHYIVSCLCFSFSFQKLARVRQVRIVMMLFLQCLSISLKNRKICYGEYPVLSWYLIFNSLFLIRQSAEIVIYQILNVWRCLYFKALIWAKSKTFWFCFSMESTTDTGSTITLFDRASFYLQNTIFPYSCHHWLCIFANDEQFHCLRTLQGCLECGFSHTLLSPQLKHYSVLISIVWFS